MIEDKSIPRAIKFRNKWLYSVLTDASYYTIFYSIEMGEQALVKTVANVFREICYANRDQMTAGIICAGWDKRQGGQVI